MGDNAGWESPAGIVTHKAAPHACTTPPPNPAAATTLSKNKAELSQIFEMTFQHLKKQGGALAKF